MKYTCILAAETDATFITSGRSTSLMMMFMPDSLMTSWSWFFLSLMHPYLGMNERISFFLSCIPCGRYLPMREISDSGRYGNISELTNRTLLTESPIFVFLDKILTKIRIIFDISLSLALIGNTDMAKGEKRAVRRRIVNAYVSSVISISLVLLLVGVASLLLVNARSVSDYFKENMQVSVMLKPDVSDEEAARFQTALENMSFIRNSEFISRERGASEMAELLGDDFLRVFDTAPIPVSIDVTLDADYVSADSLEVVKKAVSASPLVDEVVYQQSLVEALNANLSKISSVLAIFIALLLFISFVLINNTVRLSVFDRRFSIHTMKMVGATRGFIRAPFLVQALFQGLFSAILAIIMLLAILFVVRSEFVQLFEIFRMELLLSVMGIVTVCGVAICMTSTLFVVNRLISLNKDELYF